MDVCFGCIVEGEGERLAVPILLRRVAAEIDLSLQVRTITARHSRQKIIHSGELERAVQALSYQLPDRSGIVVYSTQMTICRACWHLPSSDA